MGLRILPPKKEKNIITRGGKGIKDINRAIGFHCCTFLFFESPRPLFERSTNKGRDGSSTMNRIGLRFPEFFFANIIFRWKFQGPFCCVVGDGMLVGWEGKRETDGGNIVSSVGLPRPPHIVLWRGKRYKDEGWASSVPPV